MFRQGFISFHARAEFSVSIFFKHISAGDAKKDPRSMCSLHYIIHYSTMSQSAFWILGIVPKEVNHQSEHFLAPKEGGRGERALIRRGER